MLRSAGKSAAALRLNARRVDQRGSLEPAHAISIDRGDAELFQQAIVDDHTDGRADDRYQLRELRQVDVIAVLLLKLAPIEIVERGGQVSALLVPTLHLTIDIGAMRIAGKRQLKYVQQVQALAVVLAGEAIQRGDFE